MLTYATVDSLFRRRCDEWIFAMTAGHPGQLVIRHRAFQSQKLQLHQLQFPSWSLVTSPALYDSLRMTVFFCGGYFSIMTSPARLTLSFYPPDSWPSPAMVYAIIAALASVSSMPMRTTVFRPLSTTVLQVKMQHLYLQAACPFPVTLLCVAIFCLSLTAKLDVLWSLIPPCWNFPMKSFWETRNRIYSRSDCAYRAIDFS